VAPLATSRLHNDARYIVAATPAGLPRPAVVAAQEVKAWIRRSPDDQPTPCLCGFSEAAVVSEVDRHGLPIHLVLCRDCGLIRADPQPTAAWYGWFYRDVYRRLYGPFGDIRGLFGSKAWKGPLVQGALAKAGRTSLRGPIVDLGCGGGWTLAPFAEQGLPCIGYDYDARLLALGRERGLDLREGGVDQAMADGVQADVLILAHVVEHVPDPVGFLRSVRPLLRAGGAAYVEVPHTRRIGTPALGHDSLRYWQRAHLWEFQHAHVVALLRRAGYVVEWDGEDGQSVYVVATPRQPQRPAGLADPDEASAWPPLGAQVEAELLAFERKRRSLTGRVERAAWMVRRRAGALLRRLGLR
jgi:SAM-dependent methyltransferase